MILIQAAIAVFVYLVLSYASEIWPVTTYAVAFLMLVVLTALFWSRGGQIPDR